MTTIQINEALSTLIYEASEILDPRHQGVQWPDPIAWDGRPLDEQARDMCALLDASDEDASADLSGRIWLAVNGKEN